jgi:hypothetical protein
MRSSRCYFSLKLDAAINSRQAITLISPLCPLQPFVRLWGSGRRGPFPFHLSARVLVKKINPRRYFSIWSRLLRSLSRLYLSIRSLWLDVLCRRGPRRIGLGWVMDGPEWGWARLARRGWERWEGAGAGRRGAGCCAEIGVQACRERSVLCRSTVA